MASVKHGNREGRAWRNRLDSVSAAPPARVAATSKLTPRKLVQRFRESRVGQVGVVCGGAFKVRSFFCSPERLIFFCFATSLVQLEVLFASLFRRNVNSHIDGNLHDKPDGNAVRSSRRRPTQTPDPTRT